MTTERDVTGIIYDTLREMIDGDDPVVKVETINSNTVWVDFESGALFRIEIEDKLR